MDQVSQLKSVTIHPEVTQFRYTKFIPRLVYMDPVSQLKSVTIHPEVTQFSYTEFIPM